MMVGSYTLLRLCVAVLLSYSCLGLIRPSVYAPPVSNPIADPKAVVTVGNARFTILTSQLVRAEWTTDGKFEDRASLGIVNRLLPVPAFTVDKNTGFVAITTKDLTITYKNNGGSPKFSESTLTIEIKGLTTWNPNSTNSGNLLGTIRTLDGVNGGIELDCKKQSNQGLHCTYGLISRLGWNLVDESSRPLFDGAKDWSWVVPRSNLNNIDWYFFGHGLNYSQALYEFTLIGGKIPLPPRFTFGLWWSRYWAYSDIELIDLVSQFETHQVPLDVLVIDMDWHLTFYKEANAGQKDQAGQTVGWTGFTWDPNLFPNPDKFLDWVKAKGLKSTLNLHPASGVQPHELRYPQMAAASGIDPATKKYVPFDYQSKKFMNNLYNIMLQPLEQQGINFWWLDWQQGEDWGNITGLNPTIWLNYAFFTNPNQWKDDKRPLLFHRWGGLGNHRYQIGFTGDVAPSWDSLTFQTYFTATAANVGYGYWSHDIGGHLTPNPSPELYTRWIQWGAFAPVLRTHTTKNGENERRIWAFPLPYFLVMRDAFVLRASLVPYIYTAARIAYDTGVSIIRGLYYSWPTLADAYNYKGEFLFGDDIVVYPVTIPTNTNGLAAQSVWIPPGRWIEWFSGIGFSGPSKQDRTFALDDIPVYVRAGGVIPLEYPQDKNSLIGGSKDIPSTITFVIFASLTDNSGEGWVYDDGGNSNSYSDQFGWTKIDYSWTSGTTLRVSVYPVSGGFVGFPELRNYRIVVNGVYNPTQVTVNGKPTSDWKYQGDNLAVEVLTGKVKVQDGASVNIVFSKSLEPVLVSGIPLAIKRAASVKTLIDGQWAQAYQEDYKSLILAASAGQRMSFGPESAVSEISQFGSLFSKAISEVSSLSSLNPQVRAKASALLTSATPIRTQSVQVN